MKISAHIFFLLCFLPLAMMAQTKTSRPYPSQLVVAADGSGDYRTITEALRAFRGYSPVPLKLHIRKGRYKEKLTLPHDLCNLTITGEDRSQTIIEFDDYAGKPRLEADTADGRKVFGTFTTYTVTVRGNNIRFENLTIRNNAGRRGQAVALHVEGDRFAAVNCTISGNQDTLFAGNDRSRQFYDSCLIEGTTDFIFGPATAYFLGCEIRSLSDSYITAASTTEGQPFGFVFEGCRLTAAPGVNKVWLGRPWRAYAKTVFMNCEIGAHILPQGWHNWGDIDNEKTALYAEYRNSGPGASTSKRVAWSKQLTRKTAARYTIANVFQNWTPKPIND